MKKLVMLAVLMCVSSMWAQNDFKVIYSSGTVALNECLKLKFVCKVNVDEIEVPEFEGFKVESGPTVFSKEEFVNDERVLYKCFVYVLKPISTGDFTIKQAFLPLENSTLSTPEFTIKVVAESKYADDSACKVSDDDFEDVFVDEEPRKTKKSKRK